MTPVHSRQGVGPLAELFERLDEILVEESPMHPIGCATWEEAARIAIDMAKDALSSQAEALEAMAGALERIEKRIEHGVS